MTRQELITSPISASRAASLSVAVIVGSVRQPRVGRVLGDWVAARANRRPGLAVDLIDLAEADLPLASTRPGGVLDSPIAGRLAAADAYVVVTPEYNHSFPAALKNAIDWHYREWMLKPVAFLGYGAGSGGIRAIEQLRLVFAELSTVTIRNSVLLSQPWERVTERGFAADPSAERAAETMLDELSWWAATLHTARIEQPWVA
jgi:NAD(P)H-dependent FMN reductase